MLSTKRVLRYMVLSLIVLIICVHLFTYGFSGYTRTKHWAEYNVSTQSTSMELIPGKGSKEEVRILCWVLTGPENHKTRAIHVKRTWGRRFNKFLLMSSVQDKDIGTIALPNVKEGDDWLWAKTKEAFKYVWEHHRDEADWFMKADDDTYVVVENLRKFLKDYSPTDPVFFGCHFSGQEYHAWASGGAGYVLSKEALKRFIEASLPNPIKCHQGHEGSEDVEMAKCLQGVGVHLGDSRDPAGRHRFHALGPSHHLYPQEKDNNGWIWKYLKYPIDQGMDCCASDAISFHMVGSRDMYIMEYFLYHLHPDGVNQEIRYVQEYPLEFTQASAVVATAVTSSNISNTE